MNEFLYRTNKSLQSLWDSLADRFNTYKNSSTIHPDAAVNIYVGWPVFFELIDEHAKKLSKEKLTVLDFGCGAGEFCKKLYEKGHQVYGVDHSKKMIELAKKNLNGHVTFINTNHKSSIYDSSGLKNKFDVVTTIHSTEWIEDIYLVLEDFNKLVNDHGLIIISVFPKSHVIDSLKIKDLFEDFDSETDPHVGFANFNGLRVPVYIRDENVFDEYFLNKGFKKILSVEPDYPKDFFEKYEWTGSKFPEMKILAYERIS